METKLIEVRDHGTCFVALCTKVWPIMWKPGESQQHHNRLQRMAWRNGFKGAASIIFTHLGQPNRTQVDPFEWGDRTLGTAHLWIEQHWNDIPDGGLVDVRVILKEAQTPASSEFTDEPVA